MRSLTALALAALLAAPATANDANGAYAVDGVGARPCKDFTAALAADDPKLAIAFVGWTDGFISATNALAVETFDLTPWQTSELIVAKMRGYCERNPDEAYVNALGKLLAVLRPDRLATHDEVVQVRWKGKAVLLYRGQLEKVRAALVARGLPVTPDEGVFDETLSQALEKLQADLGLPRTGLPDQPTLIALFEPA